MMTDEGMMIFIYYWNTIIIAEKKFLKGGKGGMGVCGENEKSNFPHKYLFISYSNKLYSVI